MDEKDFRIKEYMGEFTIQRKFLKHYWYSGKITESWERIDVFGRQIFFNKISNIGIMLEPFDSLIKAKKWIKSLLAEPKYHKI